MFLTVSRITRQDAAPITATDYETVIPGMATHAPYYQQVVALQAEGKIIYRSGSINGNGELETVTLYQTEAEYTAFRADPSWAPFEAELVGVVYNPVVVVEETI